MYTRDYTHAVAIASDDGAEQVFGVQQVDSAMHRVVMGRNTTSLLGEVVLQIVNAVLVKPSACPFERAALSSKVRVVPDLNSE